MIKFGQILITAIYWLQTFLCPVFLCFLVGVLISKSISITALIIGAVAGIVVAEYIRRKIGLDTFFAGIYGTNEMGKNKLQ